MEDPLDRPSADDGDPGTGGTSGPGAPPERSWRHPSEVGLEERGAADRRRGTVLGAVLVVAALGALAGGALLGLGGDDGSGSVDSAASPRHAIEASVATVAVVHDDGRRTATALVLDDRGRLVTRSDVLAGATEVWATCGDRAPQPARVLGVDEGSGLAVVEVRDAAGRPVVGSAAPRTGERVLAVRSLGGEQPARLLEGQVLGGGGPSGFRVAASMNRADGAVFDHQGRFLGLVTSSAGSTGAVQTLSARAVVGAARRIAEQAPSGGWIGVVGSDLPDGGVHVDEVVGAGPAAASGIVAGDVVVGVDGTPVRAMSDLSSKVSGAAPGTQLVVVLRRDGEEVTVDVTVAERPG